MALWFCLKSCGLCCACLSVWAILQLGLMGVFYFLETPILIEDVEAHHPKSFADFITETRKNYRQAAYNCWAVACIYGGTFVLSVLCIVISNKRMATIEKRLRSDDLVCGINTSPSIPSAKSVDKKDKGQDKGKDKGKKESAASPFKSKG